MRIGLDLKIKSQDTINIKSEAFEEIVKNINDGVFDEIEKILKDEELILYSQAKQFLQNCSNTIRKMYNIKKLASLKEKAKVSKETENINLYHKQIQEIFINQIQEEEFKKFIKYFFIFQKSVLSYYKKTMEFVYVDLDKNNTPILYKEEINANFGENIRKRLGSGNKGLSGEVLKPLGKEYINENFDQEKLQGLQQAFKKIHWRGKYSQSKLGLKSNMLILWKPKDKWKKIKIQSVGPINEAYAAFYLRNREKPTFNKGLEQNIDDFLLDKTSGVINVTNLSGLFSGDISEGDIEYAVKSAGASLSSLYQLIELAINIINANNSLTKDYMDKLKKYYEKTEVPLAEVVSDKMSNIISDELIRNTFLKEIRNNIKQ